MSASASVAVPGSQRAAAEGICADRPPLPPWLWFWLLRFLLLVVPIQISTAAGQAAELWRIHREFAEKMAGILANCRRTLGVNPICDGSALNSDWMGLAQIALPAIIHFAPYAILLVGAALALLPYFARAYVEWKESPRPLADDYPTPAVAQIRAELSPYRSVVLRDCLARSNLIAFVYPLGFFRTGLAIGGAFPVIWRKQRDLARAILAHELSHWRQGEGMLLHAGSPLLALLRYLPWAFLVLVFGPLLFQAGVLIWEATRTLEPLTGPARFAGLMGWGFLRITVPAALLSGVSGACGFAAPFVPMIAAVWSAEFCADRVAAGLAPAEYLNFLWEMRLSGGRWVRMRDLLTHPPQTLRIWFAARWRSGATLVLLLLVVPLGYVLMDLPLFIQAATEKYAVFLIDPSEVSSRIPYEPFLDWSAHIGGLIVKNWWRDFLPFAAYIALWPAASAVLARLRGLGGERSSGYRPYAVAAGVLLGGSAASYLAS